MDSRPPTPETRNRVSPVWIIFAVIHIGFLARLLPFITSGGVLSDIRLYREWAYQALNDGVWQGIDAAWVYPVGALVPMLFATVLGPQLYQLTWFLLFAVLNAAGVAALIRTPSRQRFLAAYWWLAATALLGPVAVGRLDGLTAPMVIVGILLLGTKPVAASLILSAATWVKVWPAAVLLAAVVTLRSRVRIVLAGAALSIGIAAVVVLFGDLRNLTSFLGAQGARGMQLEAPLSTPGVWQAITGSSGAVIFEDDEINTMEVRGALSAQVAALMSPLLAVALVLTAALVAFALRRGAPPERVLAAGSLALVSTLVVFNKVGSPQFMLWIAAVIAAGMVLDTHANWRFPAIAMLVTAGLTTLVYPIFYDALRFDLSPAIAAVLTVRNLLVICIFGWSLVQLGRLSRHSGSAR
ncbi:glycosyltransferase 87 family protein [Arthrobacter sp. Br18]|uniref:glycosyltransferase 87 family protein n=1 Tax=Arthrobacter sp. Br18 TaxID=1312954 RepID=UPI00138AF3D6|nr:glycosyltransferase 87 family protein [Arthrobacter sp. Br18]